ncbi:hypothetical protein DH2020_016161 [Rehmannia glutinosa]|uniref:Uncharacterized protein n=1 Tax=Rehmannia glutinosa TaxID=99300 RepID=A0ABR0WY78_REHGL
MEFNILYTSLAALFSIFLILKHFLRKKYHLPPAPPLALPVIGHLHLLKQPLHRTFHRFSQIHGPIFSLKLGARRVVVVSSPDLVEECFTTNDIVFSNRPQNSSRQVLRLQPHHHCFGAPLRPPSAQPPRLGARRVLAGKRYSSEETMGKQFLEMVSEAFEKAESSNPEDFLPFLRWIDYRGLKKNMAALGKKLDDFYQGLLEEHRREKRNTIIGHLLSLQESDPEFYTDQTIKGFMANMIFAGTETSTLTIEWAMSVLLNHPDVIQKAKRELDSQVGHQRLLEEQDLSNLHYLRNIISETFRMFPPGPLVVPRQSSIDCKVGGYDIPRGTMLLVNAWAIHRDPEVWVEPMRFKPERFEGREVETHKLMPFGIGRRICPGAGMGQRMVGLALGSLFQCFDWERVNTEEVDLTEGVGISMPKLKPLEAMCKPREIMLNVLHESASDFPL